jgi:GGDEF domain-containing protein
MIDAKTKLNVMLEGGILPMAANADLSVLAQAKDYHVDLDNLEKVAEPVEEQAVDTVNVVESWRKLDVNLSDIINMFIATSERPTFMIRDDRIVYVNPAALRMLEIGVDKEVLGHRFFSFVEKEDWNLLAENIGEMLTNSKSVQIRLRTANSKIKYLTFQAIYLSDLEHFSFILLGDHLNKTARPAFNNLYDDITGLPNFFLFEDRLQTVISLENIKENARDVQIVAVAAVNLDNIESFRKMHIEEDVMKKMAQNLVLNLPKSATVAVGLKYHFWIMLPLLKNKAEVDSEIRKIAEILNSGIQDNLTRHEVVFSMGVSLFPQLGRSAKKLIEQTIGAVKTAQESAQSSIEIFTNESL